MRALRLFVGIVAMCAAAPAAWASGLSCSQYGGTGWGYVAPRSDGGPPPPPDMYRPRWFLNGKEVIPASVEWIDNTMDLIGTLHDVKNCRNVQTYSKMVRIKYQDAEYNVSLDCFERSRIMNNTNCPPIP